MNNKNTYNNNSLKIKFIKDIITDSYIDIWLDNTFVLFKSINNIIYLIYTKDDISIIIFNLTNNQVISRIKNAHKKYISNFRYFLDKINNRDLFISISSSDNNLKLWNLYNLNCLLDLKKANHNGDLYSACFICYNNQNYIITSNSFFNDFSEKIKIFDFNGKKIKEIKDSNDETIFIDSYYDKNYLKTYIITGNKGYVKSYDYNENKLYHKYVENNENEINHYSLIVNQSKDILKLIESSEDGNIRIWNFHSRLLIVKIFLNTSIYGICLWNNKYLFAGCFDESIKIIDLEMNRIIEEMENNNECAVNIKHAKHPVFGECLIAQRFYGYNIQLWKINYN